MLYNWMANRAVFAGLEMILALALAIEELGCNFHAIADAAKAVYGYPYSQIWLSCTSR